MGLFSGRSAPPVDGRPRELTSTGEPVISADGLLLQVDVVVRFDPQQPRPVPEAPDDPVVARWRAEDDVVVPAVLRTVLRLRAEERNAEDLLADRAGMAGLVERALRFAPAATAYDVRVLSVEISRGGSATRPDLALRPLG